MKNLLILGGMAIAGFALFGKQKLEDIVNVGERIKPNLKRLRNVKLNSNGVNFDIDLELVNPTPIPLDVSTGNFISLNKIEFFSKGGVRLGETTPNLTGIAIPPNSGVVLTGIPVRLSTVNMGEILSAAGAFVSGKPNLNYRLHLEALGRKFNINA